MTMPELPSRKPTRTLGRFAAGGRGARSNSQLAAQIDQRPSSSDASSHLLTSPIVIGHCAAVSRLHHAHHRHQSNPHSA